MATELESKPDVTPIRLGALKQRKKGLRSLLSTQKIRLLIQLGFAGFIAVAIYQRAAAGEGSNVAATSPEAFCPFGGIESLYYFMLNGGRFVPHTHISNIVLALAVLLTALLVRSAFCGWICPLGFLQDAISGFSNVIRKRVPFAAWFIGSIKRRGSRLVAIDRLLRLLKYGVLIWSVAGAAVYGVMVFRDYDPWAALLNVADLSLTPGLVVLMIILVASLFVERPWCRYACPLGAISGLLGRLSPVYLKREAAACRMCATCTKHCPMGLSVHTASTIKSPDCIGCMECVQSCPMEGVLEAKFGLPGIGK